MAVRSLTNEINQWAVSGTLRKGAGVEIQHLIGTASVALIDDEPVGKLMQQ